VKRQVGAGVKTLSGSQHRRREVHLAKLQLQSSEKHMMNSVVKSGHIQVENTTNSKLHFVSFSKQSLSSKPKPQLSGCSRENVQTHYSKINLAHPEAEVCTNMKNHNKL